MLTVVTALWVALLAGLGAAETARAATVDPNAWSVLVNRDSGKAVEVENASTADGAKVVQFTDWGGANQQWQLVPRTGVLAQVHTAGRVKDAGNTVQYSWPGVYFEGTVRGAGVGIVLNDSAADYDVQVDGATVATLVTPGRTTHWINGLQDRVPPWHGAQLQRRLSGRHLPDLLRPCPAERVRRRLAEPGHLAPSARGGQPRHQRLLDRHQPR
ncbi:RICIN domain-containing protein [Streptomyces milbemycinicus]|uniref:RICIN domain-containing protein n=1 Tax=Streptomyces milbemycinicus TaxID=476552 RepID=A0ABW8M410_9ACTN